MSGDRLEPHPYLRPLNRTGSAHWLGGVPLTDLPTAGGILLTPRVGSLYRGRDPSRTKDVTASVALVSYYQTTILASRHHGLLSSGFLTSSFLSSSCLSSSCFPVSPRAVRLAGNLAAGRGAWDAASQSSTTATYLYVDGVDHRLVPDASLPAKTEEQAVADPT